MEQALIQRETRSSVELTRNAKGDYQWSIKVYGEDDGLEAALNTAKAIDHKLRQAYVAA
jgi:hypothetical protein